MLTTKEQPWPVCMVHSCNPAPWSEYSNQLHSPRLAIVHPFLNSAFHCEDVDTSYLMVNNLSFRIEKDGIRYRSRPLRIKRVDQGVSLHPRRK